MVRWRDAYFAEYHKGHLLVAGGISDQPARWLEAMQYLDQLMSRSEQRFTAIKYADRPEGAS